MTPLVASMIFVLISLILSSLNHFLFPSGTSSITSNFKIRRMFHLSNLENPQKATHYKSLYEAYHHSEIENEQTYTSKLQNRESFNQSALSESLRDEEAGLICDSNFMVLVNTVISGVGGEAVWTNTIKIYQLPHMHIRDEVKIFGHLQLPKKCKKQKKSEFYQMGVINQNRPMLLRISPQGKATFFTNLLAYLDEYSKEILSFDSTTNYWAYISKQQPWVVHISEQPFSKENSYSDSLMLRSGKKNEHNGIYNTNNFLQINMLDIQTYQSGIYEGNHRLNIKHIFIENPSNLYVTCVYEYSNTRSKIRSIIQISFEVKHDQMSLLSRDILDTEEITGAAIDTECQIYVQVNSTSSSPKPEYKLGCAIFKESEINVKYAHVSNLYGMKEKKRKKSVKEEDGYEEWLQDHFQDLYDDGADDYMWMLKAMTPLAKPELFEKDQESGKSKLSIYIFPLVQDILCIPTSMKVVRPSLPNPIILYECQQEYFTFCSWVETQGEIGKVEQKVDYAYFHIEKPHSLRFEERKLRGFKWVKDEELLIICWGGAIDLYHFNRVVEVQTDWTAGVPMSSILPFIELFATIFCMLQVVWRSSWSAS